jgi:hypothetical protein
MASWKPKYVAAMFLLINYILSNEFVLDYKFIYMLLIGGMIVVGEKPKNLEENLSSSTLSTINLTWTDLGSNPRLRRERPTINRLSLGTALKY